jgi:hypothetical protein
MQSAAMLRDSGVTEPQWLAMVEQHQRSPAALATRPGCPSRCPSAPAP